MLGKEELCHRLRAGRLWFLVGSVSGPGEREVIRDMDLQQEKTSFFIFIASHFNTPISCLHYFGAWFQSCTVV